MDNVSVVCVFNSLPNIEYLNLFNAAAFADITSLAFKNSYLLTFPDNKVQILLFCISKLY